MDECGESAREVLSKLKQSEPRSSIQIETIQCRIYLPDIINFGKFCSPTLHQKALYAVTVIIG